jgi:hypothetical protein
MRALWVTWDGLGVLTMRFVCNPTQRVVVVVRFSQLRRPQHFYLFRGMCSAWVPGSVLGSLAWEVEPSLPVRPWPPQVSVVPLYYVTTVTSRPNCGRRTIVIQRC